ncbi:MAG: site-specific integrase [Planctomycetes bacterium]|nr:site-specific integrase [Planctomycetota bacterium]
MAKQRRGRLPRGVTRHRNGYRAWLCVTHPDRENGGPKKQKVYAPTRATVEEAAQDAERMRELKAGLPNRLPRLIDGLEFVREEFGAIRDGTRSWYECQFRVILRYFDPLIPLHSIGRAALESFVSARLADGVKPITIRHNLRAWKRIYRVTARRCGFNLPDATQFVRNLPQHAAKAIDYLTREELLVILDRMQEWPNPLDRGADDIDILQIAWFTGARLTELARVEREDIDFGRQLLQIREAKRGSRTIPLADEAVACFRRILARPRESGGGFVVGSTLDIRREAIKRTFRRWQNRLEERRIRPHAMRHSFGTELARQGHHPTVIANLMGHSDLRMAMTYCHLAGPEARAAVASLALQQQSG